MSITSQQKYYRKNPDYYKTWRETNKAEQQAYQKEYQPSYYSSHKAQRQAYQKQYRKEQTQKAFLIVGRGKIECACGCGCTDIRFLEINHKNGGGKKDNVKGSWLRQAIINGERSIEDLELTCKPYNAGVHALMLRYKLNEAPFKIIWKNGDNKE